MRRRTFLKHVGAIGAGALVTGAMGCSAGNAASASRPSGRSGEDVLDQLGVQLYTVRDLMQESVDETLARVAAVGYETVETAGLYGLTPATFREHLRRHGLRSPAGHYGLEALRSDPQRIAETAQALGQQYVVCPYLVEAERQGLDDYRALADTFNEMGAYFQEAGLQFAYHNHDFEFDTFGGERPAYDVLIERTNPDLVALEMDVYWVYKAGHEPAEYFERYPGRFALAHLKDGTAPPEKEMVDVGKGTLDFAALLSQGAEAGLEYAFVEHDQPEDAVESIRASYEYLSAIRP